MSWNDERAALALKLWNEGESAGKIADRLGGLTRNAVIGKLGRIGAPKRGLRSQTASQGQRLRRRAIAYKPSDIATLEAKPDPGVKAIRKIAEAAASQPSKAIDLPPLLARKTFEQLETNDCRWPIGDPFKPGFGFCGLPRDPEHPSYCPDCRKRAKAPPAPRKALPAIPLPRLHVNV